MIPRALPRAAAAALLVLAATGAAQQGPSDLAGTLADAVATTADAARGIVLDDRAVVLTGVQAAQVEAAEAEALVEGAGLPAAAAKRVGNRIGVFRARLDDALAAAADVEGGALATAEALQRASRAGMAALRAVPTAEGSPYFLVAPKGGGFLRPGRAALVRVVPWGPGSPSAVVATVDEDGPGDPVEEAVAVLPRGRLRLRGGPDAGSATLTVDVGSPAPTLRLFNLGAPGALGSEPPWGNAGAAPSALDYGTSAVSWRAGAAVSPLAAQVTGGLPEEFSFSVDPALPAGVSLDPATGAISGTPTDALPTASFAVTVSNLHGGATADLSIQVTPPLPPGMESLEDGFVAEAFLTGLDAPVKMALAPDGRLFFNELVTGNIRVVAADGTLLAQPFATVPVQTGAERGLLGLALAPDFATSGNLYVYAIVPAAGAQPVRGQVIRYTATGNTGGSPAVLVDDLPAATIQNGGDLQCGPDGKIYLTVGDTGDSSLAQSDASLAGRILRFEPDGGVPADNPIASSPEWIRGLRNSFDMTFHAGTGGLFASENGPTTGDEVNYVLKGKNYGWETLPNGFPLNQVGPRVVRWSTVIAPTGLCFHSGTGFGAAYADNIFLLGYVDADLRRLVVSGPALTDLDNQFPFARWNDDGGVGQKPLDILEAPGGDLLVSTFSTIWRIRRY
jgi:glucose/arabinose dehydrogenase